MSTARLVLLDAESADAAHSLRDEQIAAHVPTGVQILEPLRLSDFGAPPVIRRGPRAQPVDWKGVGAAVVRLVEAAREQGRGDDAPTHTLVAGQAPLPVFVLAGYELSTWSGDATLVNRRDNGIWDVLRPEAPAPRSARPPFDLVTRLPEEPSLATGLVAVFLSTRGAPANRDELAALCKKIGQPMTAVIEIRSSDKLTLDASNVRAAFEQVCSTLARVHDFFPKRHGLALFVAGPATLGFLAGRALRPLHGIVHVPNHVSAQLGYERAFTLPWGASAWPRPAATVLFMAANPDLPAGQLALDEEYRDIREKIRASRHRDKLALEMWPAARPDDLIQALNERRPAILHLSGHGTAAGIVLVGDDGAARLVPREGLVALLHQFADDVRVVVLNTCFGERQARAITRSIECAIGMPAEADDEAARVFAASFYRALGFGRSVKDAFDQGCAAIKLENLPQGTRPRLVARDDVDPSRVFLVEPDPADER